jgi:hypothetical protein
MSQPLKITPEQQQALNQSAGAPVYLVDATSGGTVVMMRAELFRTISGEKFDIAETYPAQEQALADVWADPQLDQYTDQDDSPID